MGAATKAELQKQKRLLHQEKIIAEKAKKEVNKLMENLESYKRIDYTINKSAAAKNEKIHSTSENITQNIVWVEEHDKRSFLLDILDGVCTYDVVQGNEQSTLTLVFVETKTDAGLLDYYLYKEGYPVTSIHEDRSQEERKDALKSFTYGPTPVLVATSVATRGLNIPNVKHVINFDMPSDVEEYVHRIEIMGNPALATSFFNEKDRNLTKDLVELFVESNQKLPEWLEALAQEPRSFGGGRPRCRGKSNFASSGYGVEGHRDQNNFRGGRGGRYNSNGSNRGTDAYSPRYPTENGKQKQRGRGYRGRNSGSSRSGPLGTRGYGGSYSTGGGRSSFVGY